MRTTPKTRATILWNYEHNVKQAKSKKARKFAQERLDLYKSSIERKQRTTYKNPMERFAQSLA